MKPHTLIQPLMRYPGKGMMLRLLGIATLLVVCLASCKKDGGTPGFVRLAQPIVTEAGGSPVIPSSITDIWVYANDKAIGVWQPNRRIPVLEEGPTTLKLIAGIRLNGIASARIQYPFYATYSEEINLVPGDEITVHPVFTYFTTNINTWFDGFEDGGTMLNTAEGDTGLVFFNASEDTANVLSGSRAAGFVLDGEHPHFRAVSPDDPAFPSNSIAVLEVDYRSDIRFLVGVRYELQGQTQTVPYVYVAPSLLSDGTLPWKHIYIDLGSAWNQGGAQNQRFYLEGSLDDGVSVGHVTLDNVKVVYR